MKRKPWLKFHTQDWLADSHLRMCSPVAHGLLINLISIAHSGDPYGHLTNGGMAIGPHEASKILSWNKQTISKAWAELDRNGRIVQSDDMVWYIPRMVKDNAYSLRQSGLGKKGGNPTLKAPLKAPLNPEQRRIELEQESETDIEGKSAREFDAFWQAYPNKDAKQTAMMAWCHIEERPPIATILAAVKEQSESDKWKDQNGRFIPAPAKWLQGGCWHNVVKPNKPEFVSQLK
jgi:hypothetical protein